MTISPAYEVLTVSVLLMAVSYFLQRKLVSRAPGQQALLTKSNSVRVAYKYVPFVFFAAVFTPHPYPSIAFAILLLIAGVDSVVQHRMLLRLGAEPAFVKRWFGTSALEFLAGAGFAVALYLGLGS